MFDSQVGGLTELATGRHWDPVAVRREVGHRLAFFRAQGLVPGDRVLLHHANTAEFFVDLLAIWGLGGCAIPMDPRLTAFEVGTLARAATPRFSLWRGPRDDNASAELSSVGVNVLETPEPARAGPAAREAAVLGGPARLDEPALVLFTSGTTGEPKGVVHTHRSLCARWASLAHCLGTEKFRRTLCLLPTHFGHGLICNSLFPWLSGQDLFIAPPFRPDVLAQLGALLDEHGITFMSSVPFVWQLALRTARPPTRRSLARVFCGSAPLSAALWRSIQEWTGIDEVVNAYGVTEMASWVAGTSTGHVQPEDGLIGVPWGATIKILAAPDEDPASAPECPHGEAGQVWVNTPALMRGYLGRDDLTREVVSHGWFRTGDIGQIDGRGFLYLRGREREEINQGGMKVYPADVDLVAGRFERTLDACTFASRDAQVGEAVAIALVLTSSGDETIRLLHAHLRRHLAKFQMPRRWYLVPEIPRTSRGKMNRATLAEACAALEPLDLHRVLRGESSDS